MPIKNGFDKDDSTINISSAFIFHKLNTLKPHYIIIHTTRHCTVQQNAALHGTAERGTAQHGRTRHGTARQDAALHGTLLVRKDGSKSKKQTEEADSEQNVRY